MEMLLVTGLIALIGTVIFGAFSNGLKLWARGISINHEGDVAILLDKMGEDLRGVMPISGLVFKGTGAKVSFPTIVMTPADKNCSRAQEGVVDQIGAVEYHFEAGAGAMYRRQANYGQAFKGQWGDDREVASGLEEVMFRYYFSSDKGVVDSSEADGKIPIGMAIEARVKGDPSDQYLKRFFRIPIGG